MNFIECVHKKHCNTTVYLVLDQAANILLKLLKVLQTSFLVLKCIQFSWTVCLVVLYSYIYFYVLWLLTDCLLISSVPHMTPVWLYWETESEREIWEQRWWAALAGRDAAPRAPRRAALQPRSSRAALFSCISAFSLFCVVDNDGLVSQYSSTNQFYNYCCICINISKNIRVNTRTQLFVFFLFFCACVYRLCKILEKSWKKKQTKVKQKWMLQLIAVVL